jgi:hypothetical protein
MKRSRARRALVSLLAGCGLSVGCDWFAGGVPSTNDAGAVAVDAGGLVDTTLTPPDVDAVAPDAESDVDGAELPADALAEAADAECGCQYGCVGGVCTGPFTSYGATSAVTTTGGTNVPLATTSPNGQSTGGGPASHADSVTVTTTTMPGGSCTSVTLFWTLDATFGTSTQVPMQRKTSTLPSDTWTGAIPMQPAASEVYFYLVAAPIGGMSSFQPSGFMHYAYSVN